MKKAADMLYLLSTFSIRTNMIEKAVIYASAGHKLFPEDHRLLEIYVYAHILKGNFSEASETLAQSETSTRNLEFLRGRVAILVELPLEERRSRLRKYLAF